MFDGVVDIAVFTGYQILSQRIVCLNSCIFDFYETSPTTSLDPTGSFHQNKETDRDAEFSADRYIVAKTQKKFSSHRKRKLRIQFFNQARSFDSIRSIKYVAR